jgi:hypothetical protein
MRTMAFKVTRYDPTWLFPVGSSKRACLHEQPTHTWWVMGEHLARALALWHMLLDNPISCDNTQRDFLGEANNRFAMSCTVFSVISGLPSPCRSNSVPLVSRFFTKSWMQCFDGGFRPVALPSLFVLPTSLCEFQKYTTAFHYRYDMQMYCTFVLFVNQHFLGLPSSGTHCILWSAEKSPATQHDLDMWPTSGKNYA